MNTKNTKNTKIMVSTGQDALNATNLQVKGAVRCDGSTANGKVEFTGAHWQAALLQEHIV